MSARQITSTPAATDKSAIRVVSKTPTVMVTPLELDSLSESPKPQRRSTRISNREAAAELVSTPATPESAPELAPKRGRKRKADEQPATDMPTAAHTRPVKRARTPGATAESQKPRVEGAAKQAKTKVIKIKLNVKPPQATMAKPAPKAKTKTKTSKKGLKASGTTAKASRTRGVNKEYY